MQPKRPLLPEFYLLRYDTKAGPVGGPRHLALGKPARILAESLLKVGAASKESRLVGGPGADLAVPRPGGEVGVGLFVFDQLDQALDANLRIQRLPHEAHRGAGVGEQFLRLAALEVCVEDKSAL